MATVGIILLAIFLIMVLLMYFGKLPALLALPIMSVLFVAVSGVPFYCATEGISIVSSITKTLSEIVTVILAEGPMRLHTAIIVVMFGGMLAQFLSMTGIAENLIRKTAELGGDRPFMVNILMIFVIALLFTSLGGLGAIVMVGTIVLPIMLSIGVPPIIAGCTFLMGISLGGIFNLVNWQLYIDVLKIPSEKIADFAVLLIAAFGVVTVAFLIIEFKKAKITITLNELKKIIMMALIFCVVLFIYAIFKKLSVRVTGQPLIFWIKWLVALGIFILLILPPKKEGIAARSLLTPIIPIILVMVFNVSIISAFICGLLYALRTTWKRGHLSLLTKSIFEGINKVIPAIALMIGIGMTLNSVTHPAVAYYVKPFITVIIPQTLLGYILTFTVLAPLTLYRGPLNIWGMGSGLIGIILSTGRLPPSAIMSAMMSVGQIQGVCDPTNTHNIWTANYLGLDVQFILKKTLPYIWVLAFIGLIIGGVKYIP